MNLQNRLAKPPIVSNTIKYFLLLTILGAILSFCSASLKTSADKLSALEGKTLTPSYGLTTWRPQKEIPVTWQSVRINENWFPIAFLDSGSNERSAGAVLRRENQGEPIANLLNFPLYTKSITEKRKHLGLAFPKENYEMVCFLITLCLFFREALINLQLDNLYGPFSGRTFVQCFPAIKEHERTKKEEIAR